MNRISQSVLSGADALAWGRVLASVHEKQRDSMRMRDQMHLDGSVRGKKAGRDKRAEHSTK